MIGGDIGKAIGEDIIVDDGANFPVLIATSLSAIAAIQLVFAIYALIQAGLTNTVTRVFSINKLAVAGIDLAVQTLKSIPVAINASISLDARAILIVDKVIATGVEFSVIISRLHGVIVLTGVSTASAFSKALAKIIDILVRVTSCGTAGNSAGGTLEPDPSAPGAMLQCEAPASSATLHPQPAAFGATLHRPTDPTSFCE